MLAGFQNPGFLGGRGNVFSAYAIVTAPVIWSTAAQTGGPLLYNAVPASGKGVTAYLLAMSAAQTTATAVEAALGIATGVSTAPTTTQAITSSGNVRLNAGAPTPICAVYNYGTVSAAATNFIPIMSAAVTLTAQPLSSIITDLGGAIEVSPGYFASVAAGATLTTGVYQIGLIWLELPND